MKRSTLRVALARLALAASLFYLLISGAAPSSVRAFVMLAMVMAAILLDRPALSMRSLGLAAAILLVLRPELDSVASAGAALIAFAPKHLEGASIFVREQVARTMVEEKRAVIETQQT